MNIQTVKLDDLVTEGLQVRCSTNKDVAAEYAEAIKDGAKFPPVIVYRHAAGSASAKAPGGKYLLADGYHRVGAARELGLVEIEADVREGGYNEALRFALQANTAHGLRLTNADKSRALELAWKNRDGLFKTFLGQDKDGNPNGLPSSNQLALLTGVSQRRALNFINGTDEVRATAADEADPAEPTGVKANLAKGLDRFGVAIPPKLLPVFRGAADLRKLSRQVRGLKEMIEGQFKANNLLFAAVPQQAIINLDNAMHEIRSAQPYCVCRTCCGTGCYRCHDHGFMTGHQYRTLPEEYKAKDILPEPEGL